MRKLIYRHGDVIAITLLFAILCLGLANLWKFGFLTWVYLASKKDALDSVSKVVSTLIVGLGGILSYFRFFRGRTFARRAELGVSSTAHKGPDGKTLYAITVSAKNVGTMTIWEPYPSVELHFLKSQGKRDVVQINEWDSAVNSGTPFVRVLEPSETATFFFHFVVPDDAWAITVFASVSDDKEDRWHTAVTISATPADDPREPSYGPD